MNDAERKMSALILSSEGDGLLAPYGHDWDKAGHPSHYERTAVIRVSDIAIALAQARAEGRREGLNQAAIYWDTMAEGPCKDGNDFAWACRMAAWCRAQVKLVEAQP